MKALSRLNPTPITYNNGSTFMPRRPRIQLDRVPLQIVQRGHNREARFFGEDDYASYLHWLGEALAEMQCFHAQIERKTSQRREPRPRGRPRLERELSAPLLPGQGKLGL